MQRFTGQSVPDKPIKYVSSVLHLSFVQLAGFVLRSMNLGMVHRFDLNMYQIQFQSNLWPRHLIKGGRTVIKFI